MLGGNEFQVWTVFRIALCAFFVGTALWFPYHEMTASPPMRWVDIGLVAAFSFVTVFLFSFIGQHFSGGASTDLWSSNPFTSQRAFFHMAGWAFVAAGLVVAFRGAFFTPEFKPEAVVYLVMGSCVVSAVYVATRI